MEKTSLIYGLNPVIEALRAGRKIREIYIYSGRHEKVGDIIDKAKSKNIRVNIVNLAFFDERFPKGHQGVAAKVNEAEYTPFDELLEIPAKKGEAPFFLILDEIEDPGNLGAIMRTAESAGIHGIVLQKYRAVGLSPAVYKASSGAAEYVRVSSVANIKNAINAMKKQGILIIGAEAGEGKTLWDIDMTCPVALVIGSEGQGLRKTVKEKCDALISLPMRGKINSLNAASAAGIIIFEILRQRLR
jgi:23S rRNA (guanosine2251-2'-O)-methyltransferase